MWPLESPSSTIYIPHATYSACIRKGSRQKARPFWAAFTDRWSLPTQKLSIFYKYNMRWLTLCPNTATRVSVKCDSACFCDGVFERDQHLNQSTLSAANALHHMGGPHQISWRLEQSKRRTPSESDLGLEFGHRLFLGLQPAGLLCTFGLVSQFLINKPLPLVSLSKYIHI